MAEQCRNCLLPAIVPNAAIDKSGVCGPCREFATIDHSLLERQRQQREEDLEAALESCRGKGEYDCLVNLSGGKDSCYLLYKLKREYKLNVLAFTTDMNVPEIAWKNIRRTVDTLDVPLLTYKPPREFYRKLFRFLLERQEARGAVRTVCYVCAPLFEGYSLKVAVEKRIPLIVAGYSPGQPDPERMSYEFSRRLIEQVDWTPAEVRDSGLFDEHELQLFWNPHRYASDTAFPRYLAPFHAWEYSQAEVMEKVVELGLIANKRFASPVHSNCPVNWLLMYSDLKNLGYNPYTPEFSQLIREGKASRFYWRVMTPVVNFMIRHQVLLGRNVKESLKWLGMSVEQLRITRPAGAGPTVPNDSDVEQLLPALQELQREAQAARGCGCSSGGCSLGQNAPNPVPPGGSRGS